METQIAPKYSAIVIVFNYFPPLAQMDGKQGEIKWQDRHKSVQMHQGLWC